MTTCAKHPDRDGEQIADLVPLGEKRFMCLECRIALVDGINAYTDYKGKREAWDDLAYDYSIGRNGIYYDSSQGYERLAYPTEKFK